MEGDRGIKRRRGHSPASNHRREEGRRDKWVEREKGKRGLKNKKRKNEKIGEWLKLKKNYKICSH